MKRVYLLVLAVVVGWGAAAQGQTNPPPAGSGGAGGGAATTPTRSDPPRVAAFNVAMLMKKFDKWQYYAVTMENARIQAAIELLKVRNDIQKLQETLSKTTELPQQNALIDRIKEMQFAFEKRERQLKDQLDADAGKHLKELFADLNTVVDSVVAANGYDIVFAYPEATTKEEADRQEYIDLKLRATAAMPFYVSKRVDITQVMIDTLNAHRKAPGPIPQKLKMPDLKDLNSGVMPTGGTGGNPTGPTAPGGGGR